MFKRLLSLLTRKPRRQIQHPELGLMTLHQGYWRGEAQGDGRKIGFMLAGMEAGPNAPLVERLRTLLNCPDPIQKSALDFLCQQKRLFNPRDFTLKSVHLPRPDRPDVLAMEFLMEGDKDGRWRVEFELGQPKSADRQN